MTTANIHPPEMRVRWLPEHAEGGSSCMQHTAALLVKAAHRWQEPALTTEPKGCAGQKDCKGLSPHSRSQVAAECCQLLTVWLILCRQKSCSCLYCLLCSSSAWPWTLSAPLVSGRGSDSSSAISAARHGQRTILLPDRFIAATGTLLVSTPLSYSSTTQVHRSI